MFSLDSIFGMSNGTTLTQASRNGKEHSLLFHFRALHLSPIILPLFFSTCMCLIICLWCCWCCGESQEIGKIMILEYYAKSQFWGEHFRGCS
jgi:hypothetical protein